PVFSKVKINEQVHSFSIQDKEKICERIKQSALTVIQKKGATVFAPASNTADMVEAIMKNQHRMMICSANLQGEYGLEHVSLGVPVILGKKGVEKIEEWNLDEEELQQLQEAGRKLKELYLQITKGF
ncbi:MAG TPA: malate dehydrogenase, partial [Candidatus Nanoarchaeia archaeon]|nr:malate dehydrogenase [Candidatus Nanoarchaeia archaeon]